MIKINKLFTPLNLLFAFAMVYAVGSSIVAANRGSDFEIFLDAARKLNEEQNIYAPPYVRGLQYYYSVFFAFLLTPFSSHYFITVLAWNLLSYVMLYRAFLLLKKYFDFSTLSRKQYITWLFITVFLSIQFILINVQVVQVTIFLLWAIFESLDLVYRGKHFWGGALLGVAINIKILPVLLLPYLLYRGYFKAFSASIIMIMILLFIPAFFIGYDYNVFLLAEWWKVINPGNPEHIFETEKYFHDLNALIPAYLTDATDNVNLKRNIYSLNYKSVALIIYIIKILFAILFLFFLRTLPFKKQTNELNRIWELSYLLLLIPLVVPHQQQYSMILAIPMVSYLIYFFVLTFQFRKSTAYLIAFCTFAVAMLFYSPFHGADVIGKHLFNISRHYKWLSFATILMIPVSMYCSPQRLQKIRRKASAAPKK